MAKKKRTPKLVQSIPFLLFGFLLLIYSTRIAPTVTAGDIGDFLTAIYTRTLPHPPGFPLFSLVGIGFSFLPFPLSFVSKVGLASAVSVAASATLFYLLVKRFLGNVYLSLLSAFVFAFLYPVWLYAELAEVFGLTLFFEMLLLYLCLRYYQSKNERDLFVLSFAAGLSLSAHQVLILLFPTLFLMVFFTKKELFLHFKILLQCLGFFLLGLLPYFYVPLAGHYDTLHKWGDITSLSSVIRFIFRSDYGWATDAVKVAATSKSTLLAYTSYWAREFSFFLLVSFLGIVQAFRRDRLIGLSFCVGLFFFGPFFVLYSGLTPSTDELLGAMERFYLLSSPFIVFFFSAGLFFLGQIFEVFLSRMTKPSIIRKRLLILWYGLLLFIPLFFFSRNAPLLDLSSMRLGEQFAHDSLQGLPKTALILSTSDTATLNFYFLQHVLHENEEITLLPRLPLDAFIHSRSSLLQERNRILHRTRALSVGEADELTLLLHKDSPYTIYSTSRLFVNDSRYSMITWIPYGLLYKLAGENDANMSASTYVIEQLKLWKNYDLNALRRVESNRLPLLLRAIPRIYARHLIFTADYLRDHYGNEKDGAVFLKMAIDVYPRAVEPYEQLGMYAAKQHKCSDANRYLVTAASLDPQSAKKYLKVLEDACR